MVLGVTLEPHLNLLCIVFEEIQQILELAIFDNRAWSTFEAK